MRRFLRAPLSAACLTLAATLSPLTAAEPLPPTPPPNAVPRAAADTDHPQLVFLLDYLYAQSAWSGDLTIPYRPDITLRLVDLLTPEEAKAYTAGGPSATVVAGFRQAEADQSGALAQAYLEQLRTLAAELPETDRALAAKLIDGMVQYQSAIYLPNRLFAPPTQPPPVNDGYRRRPPAPPAPGPGHDEPPPPGAPPAEAAQPDPASPEELDRQRHLADRARNEAWMRHLSAAELTRVAAFLADPRGEVAGVSYYDRTLRLYIGRTPVRLSDLFAGSAEFRVRERQADLTWKRQLLGAARTWQTTIGALRNIAAQEQAARLPVALRPGVLAVLKVYHGSLQAQQALQAQYEGDLLTLIRPQLPATERAALEKRRDEFPNTMRGLIEQYGADLEAAWTPELEKAVIGFYTRTKRLDYVKDHLHPQGKEVLEKATAPNGDQF